MSDDRIDLARTVRQACIDAAIRAFEDAGISGLCEEGRWECAVQAMRAVDLEAIVRARGRPDPS